MDATTDSTATANYESRTDAQGQAFLLLKVVAGIQLLLVMTLNPVAIAAIVKAKIYKRNLTSILIVFQFLADTLGGVAALAAFICQNISEVNPRLDLSILFVLVADTLLFTLFVSLGNTFLIGLERFLVVYKPELYKLHMSEVKTTLCAVAAWALSFAVVVCPTVYKYLTDGIKFNRFILIDMYIVFPNGYSTYVIAPSVVTCLILICLMYSSLVAVYWRSRRAIVALSAATPNRAKTRKLAKTALITCFITVACWSPIIFFFIQPPKRPSLAMYRTYHVATGLLLIPMYANCISYFIRQPDYKLALSNMAHNLQCTKRRVGVA